MEGFVKNNYEFIVLLGFVLLIFSPSIISAQQFNPIFPFQQQQSPDFFEFLLENPQFIDFLESYLFNSINAGSINATNGVFINVSILDTLNVNNLTVIN